MTAYQQHVALASDRENVTKGTVKFATMAEYQKWRAKRFGDG